MSNSKPKPKNHTSDHEDTLSVIDIIRGLQNESMIAKKLSVPNRQACVEHLTSEGYSVVEIAKLFKVTERTIYRDRQEIQVANAIQRDPALVGQFVGRLTREADLSIGHLRKIARDNNTSPSVKVDAEYRCYMIQSDLVQNLQRLGYMPIAAHEIRADLTHHFDNPQSFDEMLKEVAQLEHDIANAESLPDESTQLQITELKMVLTQCSAIAQINAVKESIQKKEQLDDERH